MPGSRLDYDNSAFYYFFTTILVIFLTPFSYYLVKRIASFLYLRTQKYELSEKARTKEETEKFTKIEQDKRKWSSLFTKSFLVKLFVVVVGWYIFFFVLGLVNEDSEIASYDPFKILEVEHGSNERQIKRAYRVQSLKWHPDKNKDPDAERRFMAIAKAYAALTDKEARENWEKWGNPDGRQSMEVSIGLPKFLVDGDNQNIVLIFYMVTLIICIPTAVWYYYSWSQQFGDDGILFETQRLYQHPQILSDHINIKHLPEVLAMSKEFEKLKMTKANAREFEKLKKRLDGEGVVPKFRQALKNFFDLSSNPKALPHLKSYYLIVAHLHRMTDTLSADMQKDLDEILRRAPKLIDSMLSIGLMKTHYSQGNVGEWLVTLMNILNFRQAILQGIWLSRNPKSGSMFQSSLLQLPHFGEEQVHHVKKSRGKSPREEDLRAYLRSEELRQTGKKRGQRDFTEQQQADTRAIMSVLPDFEVKLSVGVDDTEEGYNFIAEGDLVTIDVRMPSFVEGGAEADNDDDDEGDKPVCPPIHSFVYPFDMEEKWWLFLIWDMPNPRGGGSGQRLLMSREISGQDRLDSLRTYKEIEKLERDVAALRASLPKTSSEDSEVAKPSDASAGLRQRKGGDENDDGASKDNSANKTKEEDAEREETESRIFDLEEKIVKQRSSLKTRLQFLSGPPKQYKMRVIVKSSCYVGLDHTSTEISFDVTSRDKLPAYKVHEEDKMLDMEPTLFDAMAGNWPDEEDDDFGSDADEAEGQGDLKEDVGADSDFED